MRPGEFYVQNISGEYRCDVCGESFGDLDEVTRHCIEESGEDVVQQSLLD